MGQRLTREQQRAQNRLKLLRAAEKVFAERGIQGASLDEVAAEAGLTKGAVYSNFANKEDLILEVMWGRAEQAEAARLMASGRSPEQLVEDSGALWAATFRSGERARYAQVALEFLTHALRHPAARERLVSIMFPPMESDRHPLAPPGSELAKLPPEQADVILKALDVGMAALAALDPKRCPPELYAVALRLLAGMEIDESRLPSDILTGRSDNLS